MDGEAVREIESYGKKVISKLEDISSIESIASLVPTFQDAVVKILQFSSKVYQLKKIIADEVKKESLSILLKTLKRSIPELSNVCQEAIKSRSQSTVHEKTEVLKRMVFVVRQIEKITNAFGSWDGGFPGGSTSMEMDHRVLEDYPALQSSVSSSESIDELKSSLTSSPNLDGPDHLTKSGANLTTGCHSLVLLYKTIKSSMEELYSNNSSPKVKFQDGKKLLSKVYEFSDITSRLFDDKHQLSPNIKKKARCLNELAADFVSMIIDASNGSFLRDDHSVLATVYEKVILLLKEVLDLSSRRTAQDTSLSAFENIGKEHVEEVRNFASEKNFIGLTESILMFVRKSQEAGRRVERMNGEKSFSWQNDYRKALQSAATEVERSLDHVIGDIEDKGQLESLEKHMNDVVECLMEWRVHASETAKGKPASPNGSASSSLKTQDKQEKENRLEGVERNKSGDVRLALKKSEFGTIFNQFPEAINDNDYKKVEILANRFLGNIKVVGDLLQKISRHSSLEMKEVRMRFQQYFKIAGNFCSQARKAVLSTDDQFTMTSLINIGKEMEARKSSFVTCCRASLSPWLHIAQLVLSRKQVAAFQSLVRRIKKIIETLRATEFLENSEFKIDISKLSEILEKTGDALLNYAEASETQASVDSFLMEMFSLQWSSAVICLMTVVDKIASLKSMDTFKMNSNQLKSRTEAWLSMLEELAVCCTDKEAAQEIAEGTEDLREMFGRLSGAEDLVKDNFKNKADEIILRREWLSKILLLSELADILTQETREPMKVYIEPLASLSFAPNLRSFRDIKEAFFDKIDAVHTMSCLAVRDSPYSTEAHLVFVAADDLKNLSEDLVTTITSSGEAKQKLGFLKMRWRVKATYLMKVLMIAPEVKFSAVAGVTRHLQTSSHLGKYEDLIAILNDKGSPSRSRAVQDSWKLNAEMFIREDYHDDQLTECNSSVSSILDYSFSRETDALTASSPRQATADMNFFRDYNTRLAEGTVPPIPLIQTPDTYHPKSSVSSTRSETSQETEIYVGREAKKGPPTLPKGFKSRDSNGPGCTWENRDSHTNAASNPMHNSDGKQDGAKISRPIIAAARVLQRELEEWEDEGNTVITVVRQMTNQMLQMADYARGEGLLRRKDDFINTAKAIAANANMVAKFAVVVADHCLDETCQLNLLHFAELVPTISTQLKIIASVKAATPEDQTADVMLIGNAENLMKSVLETLKAAESASVKMKENPNADEREPLSRSAALTMQWKKKLDLRRSMESLTAPTNDLGLKIVSACPPLALTDL